MKWPRMRWYILDAEHHVVPCRDLMTWARWMEDIEHRRVDYTQITDACYVSTVFLGLDHGWGKGPPICFETMIFGGPVELEDYQWRYSSWDDAEIGHQAAVKKALAAVKARAVKT
jgi:hypothetical protein